ncbi:MAG: polysaccharide pyruvyl transferase family protein [Dehalobacterium sp.]
MKIGILTFHYAINYGAVLQTYATQKWLLKQGIESDIINYVPIEQESKYHPDIIKKNYLVNFKFNPLRSIARLVKYKLLTERDYVEKTNKFNIFIENNLKMTHIIKCKEELSYLNNDGYDGFICGSDQIWNPEITKEFDKTYFCDFVNESIKRIAYAASAGDTSILSQAEYKKDFFRLIKNFNFIGVRERSLADFIVDESDMNAIVTLDPTLLLEKDDYEEVTASLQHIDKNYVLIYQLARTTKAKEIAAQIAKERNLEIIELCGMLYNKPHSKDIICNAGPSEMLGFIRDASYVVTNSFHGTTLSIIYQKDFSTILSKKRNSRIIDLLESLKLSNRIVREDTKDIVTNSINYTIHLEFLEGMKKQSYEFLKKSIGFKNE